MENLVIWAIIMGIVALIFVLVLALRIVKNPADNEKMQEISKAIQEGAMAFLLREYRVLIVFVAAMFCIIGFLIGWQTAVGLDKGINLLEASVIAGLLIGAMLPFLFASMTMEAVGKAAFQMIEEVRRQFKEIPGIMEEKARPDYASCVDISTAAAIREMVLPGLMAVIAPLLVGYVLGAKALGGLVAGALLTGVMLAIQMSNSGGAWDNAKKFIEAGNFGGKGTPTHAAAVAGDTVGDPFKYTAGPSMNILVKLMTIVALVFAPLFI